jgi:3-deoxy-D-manno-octulosonic acid kinase
MLSDPGCLGNPLEDAGEMLFEPEYWRARGELQEVTAGRGAAWFVSRGDRRWVLRHYRRGGFIARLSADAYVWNGEDKVRAFAEWRLLAVLAERGLPVPKPVAARYRRAGLLYRCDLITERIAAAEPLSAMLSRAALSESRWREIGAVIARLHAAGADHADLNAHNLLLTPAGAVSVIDFDRGRLHAAGASGAAGAAGASGSTRAPGWAARNLRRLRRSLAKISRGLPPERYSQRTWEWLMAGYGRA